MANSVMIALGSNYQQSPHIQWASQRLCTLLDNVRFSRCLWTRDVKGRDAWYMNRLAWGTTSLSAEELQAELKAMERLTHRSSGRVTIDLDLMQHNATRYHQQDWARPYIQQLYDDIP